MKVRASLYRIKTVYPVIGEPTSAGATHLISTLLPKIVVVGAAGILGSIVGAPLPAGDAAEVPIKFIALT